MGTRFICAGAAAVLFGAGVFSSQAQAQPADRLEAMMIATGGGGGGGELARPIPLIEERLQVAIDGQHATTTLLQVYQHANSSQIEGQYKLRPGSGSHVEGFAYWNGETKIVGEVFERQTARKVYENVTTRRRDPGLLEEDGEGAFTFKVFPIQPQEKKRVEVRWTKWLERRGPTVRYRVPVTRGDADIAITLGGPIKNLRSPTHRIHTEKVAGGLRLRSDGRKGTGSELVVEWEVDEVDWTPSVFVHPGGQHDGWFALALATADFPANAVAAKDVTIVIDRSGSMIGEPLVHAKAAAVDMIRLLNKDDRVNVIAFSDEVDPLFKTPQSADSDNRVRAIAFVERLHDGGGTDIALALTTAIASQSKDAKQRPRVVVFMTDGQSDVEKSIQAAKADTGDVRMFTVGLGKEVNRPLLQRLAALKRGRFVYIEQTSAIRSEVSRLASAIARPLLVDVSVEIDGAHAVRLYPRSLPDLFVEDELVVTGRLRGTGLAKFTLRGRLAGKPVAFTRSIDLGKAPPRPWVGRLWAQARVAHLLEELALGATAPELKDEVLELALAYNFVTPYTAFLAIPESELGDQRGTVEAAREHKRKILAENADAAALGRDASDATDLYAQQDADPLARNAMGAPPQLSPRGGDDDDDDDESVNMASSSRRGRGCAGCASSRGDATLWLVLLAVVSVLVRRRRRAG